MENALLSDISPNVREYLERRGRNLADRSKNISASKQEIVKAIYIRAVPLLKDFHKDTWATSKEQAQALRNMLMLRGGALGKDSTVGPPSLEYDPTKRQGKPTAGLTGLTVEQKGLGEGLLSVISLKGTIPSIEDLEFYLPFLFTPGNYWLLEWGFTKARGTTKLINLEQFFAESAVQELYNIVNIHRKETGENDAVIGCTKTYEYNVNSAGGFDFSIEMLSNSTLFKKNMQATTKYSIGYYDTEAGTAAPNTSKGKSVAALLKVNPTGATASMQKEVRAASLIFNTATPRDFFENLKEYMVRLSSVIAGNVGYRKMGKLAFVTKDSVAIGKLMDGSNHKIVDINTGYDSIKKRGLYYRSLIPNEKVKYMVPELGKTFLGAKITKDIIHNFDKFNNELGPYCTWGWMEDNILSIAYGMVGSEIGEVFKIESTDQKGLPNILNSHASLYTVDPSRFIIPGKTAEIFARTIINEKLYTRKVGKQTDLLHRHYKSELDVFDTYHPIVKEYTRLSEAALPFDSNSVSTFQQKTTEAVINLMGPAAKAAHRAMVGRQGKIIDMYDLREQNVPVSKDQKGSLRRLILHWSVIKEAFIGAATVDAGLKRLYNIIEKEYEGFWKFDQMSTDTKLSTIEINSISEIDASSVRKDEKGKQIYTFPSFGRITQEENGPAHDPLVISQQLSVTIPDSAALAMMFATNRNPEESLANSNFGNNIDNQLIAELTKENKTSNMIKVKPTFQRGEIRIAGGIGADGVAVRTHKIYPGTLFSLSKLSKHPLEKAYESMGTFIKHGWELTAAGVTAVASGAQELVMGKTFKSMQLGSEDSTTRKFKLGRAVDSYGKMYPGYHSRMLFFLNNQIYVTEGTVDKLVSGKTTRLLEPVKLTFKVLGVAGLNWGNKFNISYIPKKFREQTCFSIASITHNIADNNWTTEIVGTMRMLPSKMVLVDKLSINPNLLGPIEDSLSGADDQYFDKLAGVFGDETPAILNGAMSRFRIMTETEMTEFEETKKLKGSMDVNLEEFNKG